MFHIRPSSYVRGWGRGKDLLCPGGVSTAGIQIPVCYTFSGSFMIIRRVRMNIFLVWTFSLSMICSFHAEAVRLPFRLFCMNILTCSEPPCCSGKCEPHNRDVNNSLKILWLPVFVCTSTSSFGGCRNSFECLFAEQAYFPNKFNFFGSEGIHVNRKCWN